MPISMLEDLRLATYSAKFSLFVQGFSLLAKADQTE
jgi:hypothetical protein